MTSPLNPTCQQRREERAGCEVSNLEQEERIQPQRCTLHTLHTATHLVTMVTETAPPMQQQRPCVRTSTNPSHSTLHTSVLLLLLRSRLLFLVMQFLSVELLVLGVCRGCRQLLLLLLVL